MPAGFSEELLSRVNDLQDSLDHQKESIEEAESLLGALRFMGGKLDEERKGWQDLFTGNSKAILEENETLREGLKAAIQALDMLMNPPFQPIQDAWFYKRDELISRAKASLV